MLALGVPLLAPARADEAATAAVAAAAPAAPKARLVGVILSSAQALLWDDERGEYVLHKVGEEAFGGRLVELDADHVVLERGEAGERQVIEISAPPQMRVAARRTPRRMPAMIISSVGDAATETATASAAPAGAPPLATPAAAPVAALPSAALASAPPAGAPAGAPYAATATQPSAAAGNSWPATPAAPAPSVAAPSPSTASTAAPAAATPAAPVAQPTAAPVAAYAVNTSPPALVSPSAATPTGPIQATPPPAAALVPSSEQRPVSTVVISRAELDRELADFDSLSQQVQVAAQPQGGFRLAHVRSGCFFERIGLRTNDVVLRVDGRPMNGVEDASAAYAWLRVADRFTVDVLRDGRPVTLRYVVAPVQAMRTPSPTNG